jgi:hypothetical protein
MCSMDGFSWILQQQQQKQKRISILNIRAAHVVKKKYKNMYTWKNDWTTFDMNEFIYISFFKIYILKNKEYILNNFF